MSLLNLGMAGGYVSPPPPPAAMALGTNVQQTLYWTRHVPFVDLFQGGIWTTNAGGTASGNLTQAQLGSDGYPHSMPPGATWVDHTFMQAHVAGNYNLTWIGDGMSGLTIPNGSIVSGPTYSGQNGSAVISLGATAASSVRYNISNPANYPRGFACRPVGWNGVDVFNADWLAQTASTTMDDGWLRPMDATAVNRNLGYDGNWQTHSNQVTTTNRQTLTSGAWCVSSGDWAAYYTDGMPIEMGVAMANATNRNLWWTLHLNGDQAYYEAIVDAVLQAPASGGLNANRTIGFALVNEPWNTAFPQAQQLRGMACYYGIVPANGVTPKLFTGSISGTTLTVETFDAGAPLAVGDSIQPPDDQKDANYAYVKIASFGTGTGGVGTYTLNGPLVRNGNGTEPSGTKMAVGAGAEAGGYSYKFIQIMKWITDRWNASTRADKPTLKRIYEWQNAATGSWATSLLNYVPVSLRGLPSLGGAAVKDYADVYAVAPYADPTDLGGSANDVIPYTYHTVAEILQQMTDRLPTVLGWLAGCKTAAEALGKELWCYEGGPSVYLKDTDFVNSLDHDPGMYDLVLHYLTQVESTIGSKPFCWYLNTSFNSAWGASDYTGQTISLANCPKAKALQDFAAGARA